MKTEKIAILVKEAQDALDNLKGSDPSYYIKVSRALGELARQIEKRDERIKSMKEEWLEERRYAEDKLHEEVRMRIEAQRMWSEERDKAIISQSNKDFLEERCNKLEEKSAAIDSEIDALAKKNLELQKLLSETIFRAQDKLGGKVPL